MSLACAIVGHFWHSPLATSELEKAQVQLGLLCHKLVQDCPSCYLGVTRTTTDGSHRFTGWSPKCEESQCASVVYCCWLHCSYTFFNGRYHTDVWCCITDSINDTSGLKDLLRAKNGRLDVLRDVFACLLDDKFGDVFADAELGVTNIVDVHGFFVEFVAVDGEWSSNTVYFERDLGWTGPRPGGLVLLHTVTWPQLQCLYHQCLP